MTNSTLSGTSAGNGGGLHAYDSSVTLTSSTLSYNSAELGGGLYAMYGTVTVSSTMGPGIRIDPNLYRRVGAR